MSNLEKYIWSNEGEINDFFGFTEEERAAISSKIGVVNHYDLAILKALLDSRVVK